MSINVVLIALSSKLSKLQHKWVFYLAGVLRAVVPATVWLQRRDAIFHRFEKLTPFEKDVIENRVNYYNRLQSPFAVPESSDRIGNFTSRNKSSAYCSDFKSYIRFFPHRLRVGYLFGDITNVPDCPHVLKSRPIADDRSNANSVLLKLNSIRHYYFVKDRLSFAEKKPQVGGGLAWQIQLSGSYCFCHALWRSPAL